MFRYLSAAEGRGGKGEEGGGVWDDLWSYGETMCGRMSGSWL